MLYEVITAQLHQVGGEQVIVEVFLYLLDHPAETGLDQVQPFLPPDNPHVIPHQLPHLIPIVFHQDRFVQNLRPTCSPRFHLYSWQGSDIIDAILDVV